MKEVNHIMCPKGFESTNDWDSHRNMLWLALCNTKGKVVELGSGDGSTDLLMSYCAFNQRVFKSFETNVTWAQRTGSAIVKSYLEPLTESRIRREQNFGMLFIDCAPAEIRKELIFDYRNISDVILVHDSELSSSYVYGLESVLNSFKYRLNYAPSGNPHTTAISDSVNVEEWV